MCTVQGQYGNSCGTSPRLGYDRGIRGRDRNQTLPSPRRSRPLRLLLTRSVDTSVPHYCRPLLPPMSRTGLDAGPESFRLRLSSSYSFQVESGSRHQTLHVRHVRLRDNHRALHREGPLVFETCIVRWTSHGFPSPFRSGVPPLPGVPTRPPFTCVNLSSSGSRYGKGPVWSRF